MPPAWLTGTFAALMLVVAALSAARLAAARPWRGDGVITDTDVSHLLMGIAMAGMLASGLATLPNTAWAAVFAVLTAWFGYRVVRDARASGARALAGGHCAPHLVHSAAMLYMFLAITTVSGGAGMAGMSGSSGPSMQMLSDPTLAFAFALILIGYTAWDLDQLSGCSIPVNHRRPGPAVVLASAGEPALAGATARAGGTADAAAFAGVPAGDSPVPAAGTRPGMSSGTAAVSRSGLAGFLLSPGTTVGCRIAMGITMTLMLFLVI